MEVSSVRSETLRLSSHSEGDTFHLTSTGMRLNKDMKLGLIRASLISSDMSYEIFCPGLLPYAHSSYQLWPLTFHQDNVLCPS